MRTTTVSAGRTNLWAYIVVLLLAGCGGNPDVPSGVLDVDGLPGGGTGSGNGGGAGGGTTVSGDSVAGGPLAEIQASATVGFAPLTVRFSAAGSRAAAGRIAEHAWDFDDGQTAEAAELFHTFAEPGLYAVELTVYDERGRAGQVELEVAVVPPVEIACMPAAAQGAAPLRVQFGVTTMPGAVHMPVDVQYHWDFGDGTAGQGPNVVRVYERPGRYTVTVALVVGALTLRGDQMVVTVDGPAVVENRPPVANAGPDQVVVDANGDGVEDVLLDGRGSQDPDGQIVWYRWSVATGPEGDGILAQGKQATAQVSLAVGQHEITLTVTDDQQATGQDKVRVSVVARATLAVTPNASFTSVGQVGGAFSPGQMVYTVKNTGQQALEWSASTRQGWLTVSPSAGALAGGQSVAVTATIQVTPAALGAGVHRGTLAFTNQTTGVGTTTRAVELTVTTSPNLLVPGPGFSGPTPQPAPVGSGAGVDARVIARWDVVPAQAFAGTLNVGVVAFHINGIERVEFAADDGPVVTVRTMSLNPQTNVWEYWTTLLAEDFPDGDVEVRALVYPVVGIPRVLGDAADWHAGNAQSASMNTITLAATASGQDDYYTGMTIAVGGQKRKITAYDGTTKQATIFWNWTMIPASGAAYSIQYVPSLHLFANAGGTQTGGTKYVSLSGSDSAAGTRTAPYLTIAKGLKNCGNGGKVVLLDAGEYVVQACVSGYPTYTCWVTVEPDVGLTRDDVTLYGDPADGNLIRPRVPYVRWHNLTFDLERIAQFIDSCWLDDCRLYDARGWTAVGAGIQTFRPGGTYYATDSVMEECLYAFGNTTLVRNCSAYHVSGDSLQNAACVINYVLDGMQYNVMGDHFHSDTHQYFGVWENVIVYGAVEKNLSNGGVATDGIQNFFPDWVDSSFTNVAFVNIASENLQDPNQGMTSQSSSWHDHVLHMNLANPKQRWTLRDDRGVSYPDRNFAATNVLFQNCVLEKLTRAAGTALPAGVTVRNCHFVQGELHGTNPTTGPVVLTSGTGSQFTYSGAGASACNASGAVMPGFRCWKWLDDGSPPPDRGAFPLTPP